MNSESLYRYSKTRQFQPGFTVLKGSQPEIAFEYTNSCSPTDTFGLFCTIQSMGRYRCESKSQLRRNLISSYDLIYVYSGNLKIQLGDEEHLILPPHEVFIAGGPKPYDLESRGDTVADFLLISHFGVVSEKYSGLLCKNGVQRFALRSKDTFEDLLKNLEFYMMHPFQMNQVLSVNTLTQILTEIYLSTLDPEGYTVLGQPKWLLNSLEYMEKNYRRKITIADIADSCKLSASHFHKLFRESTGLSPYDYLIKLRINHAKTYLKNGDMTVKYIAYTVGFPSVNHFISYFRKETGLSPESYRKQCRML